MGEVVPHGLNFNLPSFTGSKPVFGFSLGLVVASQGSFGPQVGSLRYVDVDILRASNQSPFTVSTRGGL